YPRHSTGGSLSRRLGRLPHVMHGIDQCGLAIDWDLRFEFGGVAVLLLWLDGRRSDLPSCTAIEVLDDGDLHRLRLVVAHLDLECLVGKSSLLIDVEVRPPPRAGQVKSIASVDADGLIARCVVDSVFANELQGAVVIAAIEAHAPFWKRDAQVVLRGILEL